MRNALDSERFRGKLAMLDQLPSVIRASKSEQRPAAGEAERLLSASIRSLEDAHHDSGEAAAGAVRDEALHQERKAAKALMHLAESLAYGGLDGAGALLRHVRKLQRILGRHQDSAMLRTYLDSVAQRDDSSLKLLKACCKMLDAEEAISAAVVRDYSKAWHDAQLSGLAALRD